MFDHATAIKRIGAKPRRPGETWQGGLHPIGAHAGDADSSSPLSIAAWIAVEADLFGPGIVLPRKDASLDAAIESLIAFIEDDKVGGYVPGRIEVTDPALAERLRALLARFGVTVACLPALEHFERVMRMFDEHVSSGDHIPGLLESAGVTLEMVRAFAEGAALFARAEPWRELEDVDLIRIESPRPPRGFEYATILGAAGMVFGIGFVREPDEHWDHFRSMQPMQWIEQRGEGIWHCLFCVAGELPADDAELWRSHQLPVAAADMHPCPLLVHSDEERMRRPAASELEFLEGLFRAFAETSEGDLDSGRWSKEVRTHRGPVEFTLALPDVLDPPDYKELTRRGVELDPRRTERALLMMERLIEERSFETTDDATAALERCLEGPPFDDDLPGPRTPVESAQWLCYDAFDAHGRRRLQLARQALATSADCADAYVLLAERAADLREARDLYEQGIAAGERAVGTDRLVHEMGALWLSIDARPYLRARLGLARTLEEQEALDEAIDQYRRLIALDALDNLGARYPLLVCLLERGRDDEAAQHVQAFKDDDALTWRYGEAILSFRADGDSVAASTKLGRAVRRNPRVIDYLTADDTESAALDLLPSDEAAACAEALLPVITTTPGAREWLSRHRHAVAGKHAAGRSSARRGQERKHRSR